MASVISTEPLEISRSKFITLTKINYRDEEGAQRVWECAERKVQGNTGKDAVAIFTILKSRTGAFEPSTVIIEQYRPPMDKIIIELPAGLINTGANPGDPDESPKVAALRELEEETGYKADLKDIIDISPIVCADPGMTTAKMALVTVQITLEDEMEHPEPKPDPGEHIRVRVVEIANLSKELKEYSKQPEKYMIDARLAHFASGLDLAGRIKEGGLFS